MNESLRVPLCLVLLAALGCGDDTTPPVDDTTGSTTMAPTTGTSMPTGTVTLDTTQGPLDSSGDSSTTASGDAEIEVSVEAQPVPSGGSAELPDPVAVGAMGMVTITIDNVGGADLTIASVTLDTGDLASFVLDDGGLAPVVEAGGSTSVTVAFVPINGGRKSVGVTIASDDADEGDYAIALLGRTSPNTYRQLMPETSPSPRFNAGLTATDDGRVVLFGGRGADGIRLADTWVYDVDQNEWTDQLVVDAPSARDTHTLAYLGGGRVLLFGGNETNGPDETPLSDTWVFDLGTQAWTELLPATSPPARFQHAMTAVGEDLVLLQGGRVDFGVELADTWMFDATTEDWTDLAPPVDPGVRSAFTLSFDGVDTVAMVGGTVASSSLTDETWLYDVAANAWTMGALTSLGTQFNHAAAWLDGGLVVFAGKNDIFSEPVPGTAAYDADADAWVDLMPARAPASRFSHGAVAVGSDKALLFGGLLFNGGPGSATDELWEYVGP
ncbi:MAG: hypothetical protein KDK70_03850 [Myxococcales bacterium]|nr:hypothetical protein [Myxococcales bacterium]